MSKGRGTKSPEDRQYEEKSIYVASFNLKNVVYKYDSV